MFEPDPIIQQLEENNELFQSLLSQVKVEEAFWKPSREKWSLYEIAQHLLYEETEDFKARVNFALDDSKIDFLPIDPEGHIRNLPRNEPDINAYRSILYQFKKARNESITYLRFMKSKPSNWDNAMAHPELGNLSAKMLLTNWLVHDHLHIKQIITMKNRFISQKTGIDTRYAGGF